MGQAAADEQPEGASTGAGDDRPIRVLIVDDHEVLSASLALVIDDEPDMEAVGSAQSVEQARQRLAEARPDVVLLDRRLPDADGVESIPELLEIAPEARIVVLTAADSDQVLMQAIKAGAAGFLSKSRGLDEVIHAVRSAAAGEAVISGEMLSRLLPRMTQSGEVPVALTAREEEVLELLAEGLSNAAMAERLFVSVHTVRNHIANLSAKLGAHSKLEVLSIAVREGLLPDA